jgi:hypothetical protein
MPSLSTTRVVATQEEPDTGEEAAVAAAIWLHEWVQTNLRRLAAGQNAGGHCHVRRAAAERNPTAGHRK